MSEFIFSCTVLLSAVLLFSIQPMAAKALLPVYGGTPAVWTVCMLFFQFILLASYSYVWMISSFRKAGLWRGVHYVLILLSLIGLPLVFVPEATNGMPEWTILSSLLIQLGLPVFVLGASAPLIQYAYSQTKAQGASDPYFLYVASNIGSLSALLLYPWVFERFTGLNHQFHLWTIGYCIYLVLIAILLYSNSYKPLVHKEHSSTSWTWTDIVYWIFLSFVPCSLMLGVTLYSTTDVAATPLFWVIPLALYLLSFVITFSNRRPISHEWVQRNSVFFLLFTILGFILGIQVVKAWQFLLFNMLSFFMLALLCHGELYLRRPKPEFLTLFYFCLALGGVLAGIFNGLVAPHVFTQVYEYPLAILMALFILTLGKPKGGFWIFGVSACILGLAYYLPAIAWPLGLTTPKLAAILVLTLIVVFQYSKSTLCLSMSLLFVFLFSPYFNENSVLLQQRNFYGVKQVLNKQGIHVLFSQSTIHGIQDSKETKPLNGLRSYYGAIAPVIDLVKQENQSLSATILGLGVGTMICQFRTEDRINVVEIDPQVIDLARNTNLFTYVRDCPPKLKLIKNDGRLAIGALKNASQNVLVLDAFSSDAIPVHLLTLEAFSLYKKKLLNNGVILVNLSNRHVRIIPVLNAIARSLDFMIFYQDHKGDSSLGQFDSQWALLTRNQNLASELMHTKGWQFWADNKQYLWTDDYSNIVPLLRL